MSSLTLVRRIAARPETVLEAMTSPEGITQWWGHDAGPVLLAESDPRVGGQFRVRFRMLDGSEHESSGEYLEMDPPRRAAMSWRWTSGGDDDGVSRVEFELRSVEGGTELTFTHAQLGSDAARDSHEQGWSGALDKLQATLARRGTLAADDHSEQGAS